MTSIELSYKDKEFVESKNNSLGGEVAKLELDADKRIAVLVLYPTISNIDIKIVERLSLSICKSGFLLESGERIGTGFELEKRNLE